MKRPIFQPRSWFFSAFALVIPTMAPADDVTVTICAHPAVDSTFIMQANVRILQDGVHIPISLQQRDDNCFRAVLPACDGDIVIEASVPRSYSGRSICSTDPTPLLVAMQANRVEIVTAAFSDALGDGFPDFDRQSFLAEIERTQTVLPMLPAEGQQAVDMLYAALAVGNYPEAQRQATEAAAFLRHAGEDQLSLAYSSITYVAGFRAIGLNALAPENPLVAVGPTPSSVVLNDEGRNWLEIYQSARRIPAQTGVWDYATTASVAEVAPMIIDDSMPYRADAWGAIAPSQPGNHGFSIDETGRLLLNLQ